MVRITPIFISHRVRPFGRGPTTSVRGQKLTMVANYLLNGMILPVRPTIVLLPEIDMLGISSPPGFPNPVQRCFTWMSQEVSSLPETNSLHLKMDGWKMNFLWGLPIFRGHVSFREVK